MHTWRVRFRCVNCLETKAFFENTLQMHHRWIYSAEGWTIDNMPKPAFSDSLVCLNPEVVFRNITEVYRVGPADTSTPAISFLHKGALTMVEKKSEAFIDIDQAAVPITYVCTTGSTEWMLFSEKNFAGTSKCFGSNAEQVHCSKPDNATLKGMPTIGSVIRGCHNTN